MVHSVEKMQLERSMQRSQAAILQQHLSEAWRTDMADLATNTAGIHSPNPFWIAELRPLTGVDEPVNDYVMSQPDAPRFLDSFTELMNVVTDGYLREGKRFFTIAVGCTGGQHRSVAIAENLGARLVKVGLEVQVNHRDRGRE